MMEPDLTNPPADRIIVSTRSFPYNRALVFKAWSDPEHFRNWWGPKGFTNTFHEFDLQPGGKWRFTMHGPERGNYQNECVFEKIVPPEQLVWNRLSQPLFRVAVTLEEQGAETKVIFKMIFDSPEVRRKVAGVAVEANEENFDRLAVELEKMSRL